MTTLREAAQQALEALEEYAPQHGRPDDMMVAITALRAALAQQAEPVAWYQKRGQEVLTSHPACWGREDEPWTPLYTAPPQRKPLTDEEIFAIENDIPDDVLSDRAWTIWLTRAIERAHGIKE